METSRLCCCWRLLQLFAVIASASAQSINITITGGISPAATLGVTTSYTLNCTANSTNVTWTSYPAGVVVQVGSLTTSGSTSSRTLTLPSPVRLSYAGLYVCTASANGVSTNASYAFNVTIGSNVPIGLTTTPPTLAGAPLSVTCAFILTTLSDRPLSFQWNGPNGTVPSSGRISASQGVSISGGLYLYTSMLIFSTLSSQDNNNMYQCLVGTLYTPYSTQYTPSSSMTTVVVSALTLSPTISGPSCQQAVLQLNCTATKPLSVVPPVVFSWYRGSGGIFSPLGPGVPGTNVSMTPQGADVSTLTIAGSSVGGSYVYQCKASVAVPDDVPVVAYATTGVVNFSLYGMVSGLTLQSSGHLVWEAPVVNCNTVSYYTVTMTTYSDGTLVEMGTTTQQNYTLTRSYGPGVPYIATVWAVFGTVTGQNVSQVVFSQQLAPGPVNELKPLNDTFTTITLTWQPPSAPNGVIIMYQVTYSSNGSVNTTTPPVTITGLVPMTTYTFSVIGYTITGPGIPQQVQTSTAAIPNVSGVEVVAINPTSVRVSWLAVQLPPDGILTGYTVYYRSLPNTSKRQSGGYTSQTFPPTTTSGDITNLNPNGVYQFSVVAMVTIMGQLYSGAIPLSGSPTISPGGSPSSATGSGAAIGGAVGGVAGGAVLIIFVTMAILLLMRRSRAASGVIAMTGCAAYGEIRTGGGQQSCDVVQMDLQQCEAYEEVVVKDGQGTYEEVGLSNYHRI